MATGTVTDTAGRRGNQADVGEAERAKAPTPVLKFTLPLAPSLNNSTVNVPGKGRRKSLAYRNWLKQADAFYVFQALARAPRITVPFDVTLILPKHRGDADGRGKLVLDWLVSRNLTIDDKHVRQVVIKVDEGRSDNLVWVEVKPHARP
jgi:Holliday junction resolvase RusA-like endonuclease